MAEKKHHTESSEPGLVRAAGWLDDKLLPILGPPPLGPYDPESTEPQSHRACPLCGFPMGEHPVEVDRASGHVYLHHPDANMPEVMESGQHS